MLRKMHVLSAVLFAVLVPKCPDVHFIAPLRILHFELISSIRNITEKQRKKVRN